MTAVPAVPPDWLPELVRCPRDGGALDAGYHCERCGTEYPVVDGVVQLLPEAFADPEWVEGERAWWDAHQAVDTGRLLRGDRGLRGYSREQNLFAPVRGALPDLPVMLELGAGSSRTVAGMWPPATTGTRYVAADISQPWLVAGRELLGVQTAEGGTPGGAAAVRCEGGTWPFGEGVADVALVLGVLHHLPDWRAALRGVCSSVKPGGYVLLHEVIEKPRLGGRHRHGGVHDSWTSPHEGHVAAEELRAVLRERGTIERWRGESTPLRFALVQYLDLYERLERSPGLTRALDAADQAFGRTFGRVRSSLGFGEVMCVWRRR